jgi:hypothetical protein
VSCISGVELGAHAASRGAAASGLGAEHHVVQRGERVDQHEVLVHHADAQRDGLARAANLHRRPKTSIGPLSAAW